MRRGYDSEIIGLLTQYGALDQRKRVEELQSWSEVNESVTPAEMLDDQHYMEEYYRMAKTDLSGRDKILRARIIPRR
jgi:hypothetical protein